MKFELSRRRFLIGSSVAATWLLTGCDALVENASVNNILQKAEALTMGSQRLLQAHEPLAREFTESDLSPIFKANGTQMPDSEDYARL
ncbi:molybdopterin-binding protein, partial [Enterobacter hormaechei]|nr:molybdopterin-binding protein [Enterobacter hormaechei]